MFQPKPVLLLVLDDVKKGGSLVVFDASRSLVGLTEFVMTMLLAGGPFTGPVVLACCLNARTLQIFPLKDGLLSNVQSRVLPSFSF